MFNHNSRCKRFFILISFLFVVTTVFAGWWNKEHRKTHSFAVIPFENRSDNEAFEGEVLRISMLFIENVHKTEKFKLIEMEKLGEVLGEDLLAKDKLVENRKLYLDTVKSIGADLLFFGSIISCNEFDVKKRKVCEITVGGRVINPLNGEIFCIGTVRSQSKVSITQGFSDFDKNQILDKAVKKLAKKIVKGCSIV